jgi:hypothetical protein
MNYDPFALTSQDYENLASGYQPTEYEQYQYHVEIEQFLLFDTKDVDRIIAFGSAKCIRLLRSCDQWHIDETFKSAPSIYYQVFTIHAWYLEKKCPCVYILLAHA